MNIKVTEDYVEIDGKVVLLREQYAHHWMSGIDEATTAEKVRLASEEVFGAMRRDNDPEYQRALLDGIEKYDGLSRATRKEMEDAVLTMDWCSVCKYYGWPNHGDCTNCFLHDGDDDGECANEWYEIRRANLRNDLTKYRKYCALLANRIRAEYERVTCIKMKVEKEPEPKFKAGDLVIGKHFNHLFLVMDNDIKDLVLGTTHPKIFMNAFTPLAIGSEFKAKLGDNVMPFVVMDRREYKVGDMIISEIANAGEILNLTKDVSCFGPRWIVAPTDLRYYDREICGRIFRAYEKEGYVLMRWSGDNGKGCKCHPAVADNTWLTTVIYEGLNSRIIPRAVHKGHTPAPEER